MSLIKLSIIPAAEFKDQKYWTTESFYYDTNVNTPMEYQVQFLLEKVFFGKKQKKIN